jgi:nucleolar protein 4
LRSAFSRFGRLVEVVIPRKGNQMRGFAFVEFVSESDAAQAIQGMNAKEIKGRVVAVDWALSKEAYLKRVAEEEKAPSPETSDVVQPLISVIQPINLPSALSKTEEEFKAVGEEKEYVEKKKPKEKQDLDEEPIALKDHEKPATDVPGQ